MQSSTAAIHAGYDRDPATGATAVPVYQSASYAFDSAEELADIFAGRAPGHVYSRISNPTTYALEQRLNAMERGAGCIATASGMAAIASVCMGLLRPGDEIVAPKGIFGGTVSLFQHVLGNLGIRSVFVDAGDAQAFRNAVTAKTRMIFAETITNPSMDVPDIAALAEIAGEANAPLLLDATVTTPALARGVDLGADIVIHSTTKFINGHGTAIGGAIIDTGRYDWSASPFTEVNELARKAGPMALLAYLRNRICRDLGGCPAPQNSFLMLQGLETLHARMRLHCDNALRLARHLQQHPAVRQVRYPGLPDSPYAEQVRRQFGGAGGAILTFDLADRATAFACLNRFRLAKRMTNLGDARTLVLHPASTIFAEYGMDERKALGIGEETIRVAVGIEDLADLQQDFEQALSE
jgi:O-acetylhomoserine (thiol)-lyase